MSVVNVFVPTGLSCAADRRAWRQEVQVILAAGNDVLFVDENANETEVSYIDCSADAVVACRGAGLADNKKHSESYAGKGWHPFGMAKIYSTGTTGSITITVRQDA